MVYFGETLPVCTECGREAGHDGQHYLPELNPYVVGQAFFASREETTYVDPKDLLSRPIVGAKVTAINEDLFKQVLLVHIPQGTGISNEGLFNGCSCHWQAETTPSMRYASWVEHIIAQARITPLVIS